MRHCPRWRPSKTDQKFKNGQEVRCIFWPNEGRVSVGEGGVEKITVVMEGGQMMEAMWFAVWIDGKVTHKYNGAMLEGVEV